MTSSDAWQILDTTGLHGQLRYERGRILIIDDDGVIAETPISQTAVILLGLHANISTALLYKLAQEGVSVLTCDWRGVPAGAFDSWGTTPSRVTARHWAQVDMSLPKRKNAWMQVVKAKIRGQAACLDYAERPRAGALREMAKTVRTGDATNVEGMAAREYWTNLFPSEEQFHRIPGGGTGRNCLLDYGYTILRGYVIRSILAAGLSTTFGVNHHHRSNRFCLADDLIEPFRPAIDYTVTQMDPDTTLDKGTKQRLVETANGRFFGYETTIPSVITDFTQQYAKYCEGETGTLTVPVFGGEQ